MRRAPRDFILCCIRARRLSDRATLGGYLPAGTLHEPAEIGEQDKGGVSTGIGVGGVPGNDPEIVDGGGDIEDQDRVRGDDGVQVGHFSVLPEEGAAVELGVARVADDLAKVVDGIAEAEIVTGKGAQVLHHSLLP